MYMLLCDVVFNGIVCCFVGGFMLLDGKMFDVYGKMGMGD